MKVAIPTRGNVVDDHFGHCEAYTLLTVDDNQKITKSETLPSPQGCGCKSNIAAILQEKGVTVMLAGNMGNGALNTLRNHGIQVFRGCSGDVMSVVHNFLADKIEDSGIGCQQHASGHECQH
ncbi:NifB/NifX family molybdenum-iron cluster-binding protein [Carboxylicivirga taeanensis]|uniref:NifB/NifX family molybdenum-iron cluster-binding protein n=1 Tax=Carboxylicivirga taeanensis TaxID=1416875 RepID=UPI003F6DFBD8